MKNKCLRLVLLSLLALSPWGAGLYAQATASFTSFWGTATQPYHTGDVVEILGTNFGAGACDSLLIYNPLLSGDTTYFTSSNNYLTNRRTFQRFPGGAVDTLRFVVDSSLKCTPGSAVRLRKPGPCNATTSTGNFLIIETVKLAKITYGGNDSVFCMGSANATPQELWDDVSYRVISAPTGFVLDTANGIILVHQGNIGVYYLEIYTNDPSTAPGCNDVDTIRVVVRGDASQSMSYTASVACPLTTTPLQLSGTSTIPLGGTFSTLPPTGLSLDQNTGAVRADSSAPGSYLIAYESPDTFCYTTTYTTLVIDTIVKARFTYQDTLCSGDTLVFPQVQFLPAGTFQIGTVGFPVGLPTIDPGTGVIQVAPGTRGAFVVTFTPTDTCGAITRDTFTVMRAPVSAFSMGADNIICKNFDGPTINLTPVVNAVGPGNYFAASAGLSITGNVINVNNAGTQIGGPYYITYYRDTTYASGFTCQDSTRMPVMVYGNTPVSIQYPTINTGFCDQDQRIYPVFSNGPTGGSFSIYAFPSGTSAYTIDPDTGYINLASGNQNGNYQVVYRPNAECPDSSVVDTFQITQNDNLGIEFAGSPALVTLEWCEIDDSVLTINFTGTPTITPPVYDSLVLAGNGALGASGYFNGVITTGPTSAQLDLSTVPPGGPYPLIRMVAYGACVQRESLFVKIEEPAHADFNYPEFYYCEGASDPVPFIQDAGGGIFYCSDGGINQALDDFTGRISLTNFRIGTYVIEYSTANVNPRCSETETDTVQFIGTRAAEFDYGGTRFCTSGDPFLYPTMEFDSLSLDNFYADSSGLVVDPDSGIVDVLASTPGTYVVTRTIGDTTAGGCFSIFQLQVVLLAGDTTTTMTFSDSVYCETEANPTAIITGNDSTGQFMGTSGILWADPFAGTINLLGSQADDSLYRIVTYRLVSSNGCIRDIRDTIKIVPSIVSTFGYVKPFVCTNRPVLEVDQTGGPYTGTFTMTRGNGSSADQFIDPLTGRIDITGDSIDRNDVYEVRFFPIDTACRQNVSVFIDVYEGPRPVVVLLPDTVFCDLTTVSVDLSGGDNTLISINDGGTTNQSWEGPTSGYFQSLDWSDGDRIDLYFYQPNVPYLQNINGTDSLTPGGSVIVDTANTCYEVRSYTLHEIPLPQLNLVDTMGVVNAGQDLGIILNTNLPQTSFNWWAVSDNNATFPLGDSSTALEGPIDPASPLPFPAQIVPEFVASPATAHYIFRPIANGCVGPDLVVPVSINPGNEAVFIPEVFTPGDDGMNDRWHIQLRADELPVNYSMAVYNRSGGLVYEMNPIHDNWTGDDLPDGVYWWSLIDNRSQQSIRRGGLTIRRK